MRSASESGLERFAGEGRAEKNLTDSQPVTCFLTFFLERDAWKTPFVPIPLVVSGVVVVFTTRPARSDWPTGVPRPVDVFAPEPATAPAK